MPNPFSKSNIMSLTDVFHFGKYAKEEFKEDGSKYTLKEVIEIDFNYISWCITNIPNFDIDQEADNYFQEHFEGNDYERDWCGEDFYPDKDFSSNQSISNGELNFTSDLDELDGLSF